MGLTLSQLEYPYPKITAVEFEHLVREAYTTLKNKSWTTELYPIQTSIGVMRIITILERQPELLNNKRMRYNLGMKKTEWLDNLWKTYVRTKDRNEEELYDGEK